MRSTRTAWLLLSPTLVVLGVTGLLPFLYVLYVGFFEWNPLSVSGEMSWAGAGNYRALVFDEAFLLSVWRAVRFTLASVTIELVLGFLLAHSLLKSFPLRAFFRVVHTLPLIVAPIVVGAIFKLLMVPGFGPIPHFLDQWFDIEFNYGRHGAQAFWALVAMDAWHWTPFVTLTLLAGLSALPREPFEQALVDGANRIQVFVHLTVPMLMPVLLTTLFLRLMDAMRIVDEVWMLTGGGPGVETRFAGIHIWRQVFASQTYGYGSAMSLLLLYFTIVVCWLLFVAITARRDAEPPA